MRIFAYCTQNASEAVKRAVGVIPLSSPPYTSNHIHPGLFTGHDLIYFRLHAAPLSMMWHGDNGKGTKPIALSVYNFRRADLGGAVVVVANCHGTKSPIVPALYQAGASAVIAGPGENYASGSRVIGTDKLVKNLIRGLEHGQDIKRALRYAKMKLLLTAWRKPDRDALQFRIMERAK